MTAPAGEREAAPVTLALVNDYQVVVEHLREMLAPFSVRVVVVDMEVGSDDVAPADVVLFDTLGGQRHALARARALVERRGRSQVIVYARSPSPRFIRDAGAAGVAAVIDTTVTGERLVEAIEAVHDHRSPAPAARSSRTRGSLDQLRPRELEMLALIAMGLSNQEIADESFLGLETVRTHVQRMYRRLGVRSRSEATARAAEFGVSPTTPCADRRRDGRRRSRQFRRLPPDVRSARVFAADVLRVLGATATDIEAFELAVSELGSNAVTHSSRASWTVGIQAEGDWYTLDVSGGTATPDNVIFHTERWAIAESGEPSGRGLGIVHELMDDVTVERRRGTVRVVCRLRRSNGDAPQSA